MRLKSITTIATTAAALALAAAPGATAATPQPTTLEKVSGIVQPGIVYLETGYSGYVRDDRGRWMNNGNPLKLNSSCSGFFVNPDGHFVTAGHCVDKAEGRSLLIEDALTRKRLGVPPSAQQLRYALATYTVRSAETPARSGPDREINAAYGVDYGGLRAGKPLPARVNGVRAFLKGDVALLQIEADNVPVLELADANSINVGSEVVSVGYPASVDLATDPTFDPSFKEGSISSQRTIEGGLVKVHEISAALSGGMSGGPTVDLKGRVVGVNSFGVVGEPQPFNFVSPVAEVAELLADEGVQNTLGDTNETYRAGLAAYYAGNREEAVARFDDVLGQVFEHEFAQQFRAKALRLQVAAKPEPKASGGFPIALAGALMGLAVALAAAAMAVIRRRRPGGTQSTPPAAPHSPRPAGTAVHSHAIMAEPNGNSTPRALVISDGAMAGERITVSSELTIGREHVDVELDDAEVSRRHAKVMPTAAGLVVSDLGSANGTRVNGARIDRPTLLIDGDEIAVGTTTLCVATDLGGLRREATVMRPRPQRAHAA
jgi:hypothetical protein